jgi:uncharacterized protein with PQ loop repeat
MYIFGEETKETTFEIVIGMIGTAFSLFFFFSPTVLMINLIRGQLEIKKIPFIMLIATWFNCCLWFIYSYYLEKLPLIIGNSIGTGLCMIYIVIYLFYFFQNVLLKLVTIVLSLAIEFGIFAGFFLWAGDEYKEDVTGNVALVFNIIMYGSPGQNLV